jgi:hypothetical protein
MLIGGEQRRRLSPSAPFTPCPSRVRVSRPTVSDRVAALSSDFALPVRSMYKMPPGLTDLGAVAQARSRDGGNLLALFTEGETHK